MHEIHRRSAKRARSPATALAGPAAPAAARVLALQRAAGNRATARAVALMRTSKEISVERQDLPHTWTARFSAELSPTELTLTIKARIEPDRDVTDAQVDAVEKQAAAEFKRIWDSKFVVSEDGGKTERVVRVKLEFVAKKPHVSIQLRQGAKEDNRRIWFVSSPAITRAHELGHQLGLSDEKLDPAFENRKTVKSPGVFQDNSIMGDYPKEGADKATAKLRHGQSIIAEVGKAFGKTFTVRMNVKP